MNSAVHSPWVANPLRLAATLLFVAGACARPKQAADPRPGGSGQPIAVALAKVATQNVTEWVDAVGAVTPLSSVTVQPQIDGRLVSVDFTEGQAVAANEVLARVDARPFVIGRDNARAALLRDRATARNLALNARRYRTLRHENMVSEQQLTDAEASSASGEATVLADEAQLAQAELQLGYTSIRSPIAGVVGLRRIDAGNLVRAASGNALCVVNQIDPIAVTFAVPQDGLAALQAELADGPLLVCVYGRDGKTILGQGTTALIDNQVDSASGTVRLKALLANERRTLWPGQFVKVRLRRAKWPNRRVIPAAAIVDLGTEQFVYIEQAGLAARHPVKVALWQGESAVLAEGPPANANLVVEGQQLLRDGAPVMAQAAASEPNGPANLGAGL